MAPHGKEFSKDVKDPIVALHKDGHGVGAYFQRSTDLLVSLAIFMEGNDSIFDIFRELFTMRSHAAFSMAIGTVFPMQLFIQQADIQLLH